MADSFAQINEPCGGISINGAEPKCCEVHLLPWGHARPKCACPTNSEIDAAIEAATANLQGGNR